MANKFIIIGVSGIALCAVCLAGAATLGGRALSNAGFDIGGWGKPRCGIDNGGERTLVTRQIAWDGGDTVEADLPTDVHYHMGQGTMVEARGPAGVISQIRVRGGKITLACNRSYDLDITLPGKPFRSFVFHGAGDVDLDGIDQPDLKIEIMGAGDITASGRADRLTMTMMGAGDAHMGSLAVNTVNLTMMGAGDAEIAPIERLSLQDMGAGDVTLKHEPKEIDSHIMGGGDIIHADDSSDDHAPMPPMPRMPEMPKMPAAPDAPKQSL
jgi:hypothetical protein